MLEYTARLGDHDERMQVTAFVSWFYGRAPARVLDDVSRVERSHDEAHVNPDNPSQTALDTARGLTCTGKKREHALNEVDQMITAHGGSVHGPRLTAGIEDPHVAYWRAVRRLVEYAVSWRIERT